MYLVGVARSLSLVPTKWKDPVFFDCLLKTGKSVSVGDGVIDDDCKTILTQGNISMVTTD